MANKALFVIENGFDIAYGYNGNHPFLRHVL
jgi:hypothetical protein